MDVNLLILIKQLKDEKWYFEIGSNKYSVKRMYLISELKVGKSYCRISVMCN